MFVGHLSTFTICLKCVLKILSKIDFVLQMVTLLFVKEENQADVLYGGINMALKSGYKKLCTEYVLLLQ